EVRDADRDTPAGLLLGDPPPLALQLVPGLVPQALGVRPEVVQGGGGILNQGEGFAGPGAGALPVRLRARLVAFAEQLLAGRPAARLFCRPAGRLPVVPQAARHGPRQGRDKDGDERRGGRPAPDPLPAALPGGRRPGPDRLVVEEAAQVVGQVGGAGGAAGGGPAPGTLG